MVPKFAVIVKSSIWFKGGSSICRNQKGGMVGRVNIFPANNDEQNNNSNFHNNDYGVNHRRFLGTLDE